MENFGNLYLKINIYLIRAMYKELGKEKLAVAFVKKGNKNHSIKICEVLGVDEQRINRIITEPGNSKITKSEAENISKMFNINEEFFLNNKEYLLNGSIDINGWALFFEQKYGHIKYPDLHSQYSRNNIENIVKEYIKQCIEHCENGNISGIEMIYRIYYYFVSGNTFVDSTESRVKKIIKDLKEISAFDWKELENEVIENTIVELSDIQKMLQSIQSCKKIGLI